MLRVALLVGLLAAGVQAQESRNFRMGFTPWPADITPEGVRMAVDFTHRHGDIVSVMFIGGLPWPEALAGKPFSADVRNNLAYRPPPGAKLFLSISPLDFDRKGLAPYWGHKDNLPLPAPWTTLALDSPRVKKAFLAFTLRAVERMRPDYLAIAIEPNVLLSHDAAKWKRFKALYRATYAAVKKKHPRLPVCFTTEVLHYKHLASDARGSDQKGEVADLMRQSDLFAMSVYPHMSFDVPRPVPATFFDFAKRFRKPIAVSESGITSRDVELKAFNLTLRGSDQGQAQFTELLLRTAQRDDYEFVINYASTDFGALCDKLPAPMNDYARIWAYTGMQTGAGKPKPAFAVWKKWLDAGADPRILSIALTLPETSDYVHAFELARSAGMKTPGEITFYWDQVEQPDRTHAMPFLDVILGQLKRHGMRPVLTICPFETLLSRVPQDLRDLPLDHPKVKERFAGLIRWVHARTKDFRPLAVVIGNEFDLHLGTDKKRWAQFANLHAAAVEVIRSLPGWQSAPLALEPTFAGLTGPNWQVLQRMNRRCNVIGVSYYPTKNDRVEPVSAIARDMDTLARLYPRKRIDFYQYGYPSSRFLGSSEQKQRAFVAETFRQWDRRKDKIRILTFTWLYDLDIERINAEALRTTGAKPPRAFSEFLGTLGLLRRKPGDEKPAFAELRKQARQRNWAQGR